MEEILDKLQIFIIITLQKFKHISYSDHFHLFFHVTQHPCPRMGDGTGRDGTFSYSHFS